MKATPGQIKRIHALLPQAVKKDPEMKAELVYRYTQDPARTSTRDLEVGQAKSLISDLLSLTPGPSPQGEGRKAPTSSPEGGGPDPSSAKEQRMRRKILSICHEMGWHTPNGKLDWERIGNYLAKYGTLHKRSLNAYHGQDLVKLVTQFEKVLESSYKKGVGSREMGKGNG